MTLIPKIAFITGPTAGGKTEFIHELKDKYFPNAKIISADSIQVYKMMNIGTAKPTKDELKNYNYSLIDYVDPLQKYTLSNYLKDAYDEIRNTKGEIFVVGGTGLYIRGLKQGIFEEIEDGLQTREALIKEKEEKGLPALYEELKKKDPKAANFIDEKNERRVIRALEVIRKTGKMFSMIQKESKPPFEFKHKTYVLKVERETVYKRINKRVLKMFEKGLVDEVKELIEYGVKKDYSSMQGIGYKEVYDYIIKPYKYENLINLIQKNTRHYAKRQETWFKKEDPNYIHREDIKQIAEDMKRFFYV